jgi:hypothetical protein
MVTDEGKLVLIDFGLSVKKTELGEKQTYPEHLHSKNYKRDLTWNELKSYQEYKYQNSFNPCADPYSESVQMNKKKILNVQMQNGMIY